MGKYRVKERVAVLHGNKVTVYEPSDELVTLDDDSVADVSGVEAVGKSEPANTPDTQAANASGSGSGKGSSKK
jgi:hypothetical protein